MPMVVSTGRHWKETTQNDILTGTDLLDQMSIMGEDTQLSGATFTNIV